MLIDQLHTRVGLGCMGMSEFYGKPDDEASTRMLYAALDAGYRHFDTADMYGLGANERLLGGFLRAIGSRRHELTIATKAGIRRNIPGPGTLAIDSSPAYIREACASSLKNLGVERIDLYYLHRRNPEVPVEDSIGAMVDLIAAGKIAAIGLSEVSAATLRRACKIAPIAALQSEYSLWSRDPEAEVLAACRELGVRFVAYSPLGRGFLSGQLDPAQVRDPKDLRSHLPRFQPDAFAKNTALLDTVARVASEAGVSKAQIALAWVLAQDPKLHVIPGTRKERHLADNFASEEVRLSPRQLADLSGAFTPETITGARLPEALLRTINT